MSDKEAASSFKIGDRVRYRLRQGLEVLLLPATVQSVGPKRVVVVDDEFKLRRIVDPKNLTWEE